MRPQPPPSLVFQWWFRIAVVAALSISSVVAYALYRGVRESFRSNNYLDRMLGHEGVLGVEESGFYNPEDAGGEPFRWTNGAAKLVVPTRKSTPKALTVLLGLGIPQPVRLLIQANKQPLFDQKVSPQNSWMGTFNLDNVPMGNEVTIEIISDVFIPAQVDRGSTDTRTLGVCVHGVFLESGQHDYVEQTLGSRFVPGVEESGFYEAERDGGLPFRWSNGVAKLVVPLREKKPKSLSVKLDIPEHAAKRLEIVVNGQDLLRRSVKPQTNWVETFPLDEQLRTGEMMTIEVRSGTCVPAQLDSRSKDRRILGVKMKGITLHRE